MRIGPSLSLVAVVALLLTGCGRSPESTAERFYHAVGSGELTEAKGYLSKQIITSLGDQKMTAMLTVQYEAIAKCGGIDSVEVDLKGEGELRSGTIITNFAGDCKPRRESVKLLKEDGEWKITGGS